MNDMEASNQRDLVMEIEALIKKHRDEYDHDPGSRRYWCDDCDQILEAIRKNTKRQGSI